MSEDVFRILFDKLSAEVGQEAQDMKALLNEVEGLQPELDSIAELRKLSMEIAEPEPASYTLT
jgi:hypothetical protein